MADRIRVFGPKGEIKKIKEKLLKEITNKLEAQPISLKSSWTRMSQTFEKPSKKLEEHISMFTTEELAHGPSHFNYLPNPMSTLGKLAQVGSHAPRPPDPT